MKDKRFYEIDLLRFLAAFAVLLFHYTFRGVVDGAFMDVSFPSAGEAAKYGGLGVELFFLISGFVILMTVTGKSFRRFAISRIVRLYPAFWCCCTVTFLAALVFGQSRFPVHLRQYLVNMTMLHGFLHVESVDGVYWSLLVEMKFYVLMALLALFGQVPRIKFYLGAWLAAALWLSVHQQKALCALLMPQYAGCFVAGATFYLIAREGNSLYKTVLLLVSCFLATAHAVGSMTEHGILYHTDFSPTIVRLIVASFFIVFYLISTGKTARFGSKKFLWLGALTYPLYLLHQNLGYMLFNTLDGHVEKHVLLVAVTGFMLAAAWCVHRKIEVPCGSRLRAVLENGWQRVVERNSFRFPAHATE